LLVAIEFNLSAVSNQQSAILSVYYLKYRPQNFDQLDLKDIREGLKKNLVSKDIPHAFLFSGPKGLGKTSSARITAKFLNCKQKDLQKRPCNRCSFCKSVNKGTSLDLIEIDAASNRGIDDIRQLREKVKLAPTEARNKIYVIDEVHMLTREAFNALLKTLEEPPSHVYFILCTTEPEKIPDTIISRCQRFNFTLASQQEIVLSLKRIVKGEEIKVSDKTLKLIADRAEGSFRDASKLLQKLVSSDKEISYKKAYKILEKETIAMKEIISSLAEKKVSKALKSLNQAVEQGADLQFLTKQMLDYLRKALVSFYGVGEKKKEIVLQEKQLKKLIQLIDKAGRQLKGALIEQLPLEIAIIDFFQTQKKHSEAKDQKTISKTAKQKVSNKNGDSQWQKVMDLIKKDNHHIQALLKSTALKGETDGELEVEVFYEFHKQKLEKKDYKKLVEKRVEEVFGKPLKLKYKLK